MEPQQAITREKPSVNYAADVHQHTWYQSMVTKKYWLVLQAGWVHDDGARRWLPTNIVLLEYLKSVPQPITCDNLCGMLERGEMVVVSKPF